MYDGGVGERGGWLEVQKAKNIACVQMKVMCVCVCVLGGRNLTIPL